MEKVNNNSNNYNNSILKIVEDFLKLENDKLLLQQQQIENERYLLYLQSVELNHRINKYHSNSLFSNDQEHSQLQPPSKCRLYSFLKSLILPNK